RGSIRANGRSPQGRLSAVGPPRHVRRGPGRTGADRTDGPRVVVQPHLAGHRTVGAVGPAPTPPETGRAAEPDRAPAPPDPFAHPRGQPLSAGDGPRPRLCAAAGRPA